jgi:arylsulfatase A
VGTFQAISSQHTHTQLLVVISKAFRTTFGNMAQSPNFLLALADDLGYGDLGVSGHPTSSTPNIDSLAHGGLRMTSFYTASPVCSPSRAGLITGRFPARSGVFCDNETEACVDSTDYRKCCNGVFFPGMPGGLSLAERTMPQFLPEQYTSMLVGKWHLGIGPSPGDTSLMPTSRGFDHYFGVPHGLGACPCASCIAPATSCAISCQPKWAPCPLFANNTIAQQPVDLLALSHSYGGAAASFIEASEKQQRPWLLVYASHHTHSPQFAGPSCTNTTRRGRFGDSLREFDEEVGRMLDAVSSSGASHRTLTIITSDNGPSLRNQVRGGSAGLLRCGKGTTFEGGLRVPAIFHFPGVIAPNRVSSELGTTMDLLPTFVALSGAPEPAIMLDGVSLASFLTGGGRSPRNAVFYYPQVRRTGPPSCTPVPPS